MSATLPLVAEELPILYQDEDCVAVNKPPGLLVHRTRLDAAESRFALQILRDQLGCWVHPVHRLDKPTSGVLLFALSPEIARELGQAFRQGQMRKTYLAVVRGFCSEAGTIDHPVQVERPFSPGAGEVSLDAVTDFQRLATAELPVEVETYPTSRYSLVRCEPRTGKRHQIRKHLKHLGHPIIGDVRYGRSAHNRYFRDVLGVGRLLLAATELTFEHPRTGLAIRIVAPLDSGMSAILDRLGWRSAVPDAWIRGAMDS